MIIVNILIRYNDLILLFKKRHKNIWDSLEGPLLQAETMESCASRIVKNSINHRFRRKGFIMIDRDNDLEEQRYFYSINLDHIPEFIHLPKDLVSCKWFHLHDLECIKLSKNLKTLFNINT